MYPGMAAIAREEGHDEIADWFETGRLSVAMLIASRKPGQLGRLTSPTLI